MVRIVREYGLIVVLIIVGIASLLFYRARDAGVLEQALDQFGVRLMSVVHDEESRAGVEHLYTMFRERVLRKEVTPEQVELLAVNILNLSNSGQTLTAEEAEGVFEIVLGETDAESVAAAENATREGDAATRTTEIDVTVQNGASSSEGRAIEGSADASAGSKSGTGQSMIAARRSSVPAPDREVVAAPRPISERWVRGGPEAEVGRIKIPPPPKWSADEGQKRRELASLGERLQILLEFQDAVDEIEVTGDPEDAVKPVHHLRVLSKDGAHVVLDLNLQRALSEKHAPKVEKVIKELEDAGMIAWQNAGALEAEQARKRNEALARIERLRGLQFQHQAEAQAKLEQLAAFRQLEAKGIAVFFDLDSLETQVEESLSRADRTSLQMEQQMEQLQRQ
jgi:hypothetical protein